MTPDDVNQASDFADPSPGHWCDACEQVHPTTSRAGLDLCAGCAEEFDTKVSDTPTEARYRNPPDYYGVDGEAGVDET